MSETTNNGWVKGEPGYTRTHRLTPADVAAIADTALAVIRQNGPTKSRPLATAVHNSLAAAGTWGDEKPPSVSTIQNYLRDCSLLGILGRTSSHGAYVLPDDEQADPTQTVPAPVAVEPSTAEQQQATFPDSGSVAVDRPVGLGGSCELLGIEDGRAWLTVPLDKLGAVIAAVHA